jgi:LacI family transcriptional regulator
MDDLSRFCCQNPTCADYGKRGAGNLSVSDRYGRNDEKRILYCRTCKGRFSERKGTVLFGSQLSQGEVIEILDHVQEGCGVRKTARLTGHNRNTVSRYSRLAGEHARTLQDERVAFSPSDARSATGREMGVCRQKAGPLRSRRPGRRPAR